MKAVVLDASMALEWFFPDLSSPSSRSALGKRALLDTRVAIVPHVWRFEITNYFAGKLRRAEISAADATWNLAEMMRIPFAIADEGSSASMLELAHRHRLTAYDAAYLRVAMLAGEPLATLDKALTKAAEAVGVEIA
ncbi:MAG: type II toxin-antitoxin system VapC family toxin [Candidatus Nanopelagicales bacterium]